MSRLNDLTYYRSLLCLEESHFRFYLAVRDGTAPPSPGSKPGVLTIILTDIFILLARLELACYTV